MKDYEKKYKEALSRAATELETCGADKSLRNMIYAIFPDEIKESEDEKIRKALVRFHKSTIDIDGIKGADILAWLEKQGKSSDQIHYWTEEEIEPIINDYLRGAEHYGGMIGRLRCLKPKSLKKQDNSSAKWQKNTPDNKPTIRHSVLMKTTQGIAEGEWQGEYWFQYRWSWTLKDSDVLAWMELSDLDEQGEQKPFDYEHATITQKDFASVGETATIELSSPIDCGDRIYHVSHKPIEKNGEQKPVIDFKAKNWYVSKVDGKIHDMTYNPADKVEPRFKVKYAGSEYNVLEVKDIAGVTFYGIEDEPNHIDYVKAENCEIISGYAIKENGSPYPTKPAAWSDEDEEMTDDVIKGCVSAEKAHHFIHTPKEVADWLKSLKNRVQPQVKEWSEDDELIVLSIEQVIQCASSLNLVPEKLDKIDKWLKSLKDRIGG